MARPGTAPALGPPWPSPTAPLSNLLTPHPSSHPESSPPLPSPPFLTPPRSAPQVLPVSASLGRRCKWGREAERRVFRGAPSQRICLLRDLQHHQLRPRQKQSFVAALKKTKRHCGVEQAGAAAANRHLWNTCKDLSFRALRPVCVCLCAVMSMIATFYEGKYILITGATGFLGKVLLEKLLRTSPDLRVVYILVRPKAGQTLQQRVNEMLSCKLFDKVRETCPNVHEKIRAIYADLKHQDLGISKEDMQELLSNTNLIFHCAATVHFNDTLRNAMQLNVIATQQLLRIASQMPSLEAFVHISTAFSNCNLKHIEEVVYPCPVEPRQIIASMEWLDDAIIDEITPKLLGDRPNTYTYTKALGEMVVQTEGRNLNIAIVRPSIVGATWQEPFPGWVDNLNGPNALIVATGKGLLHTVKASPRAVADLIPADTVVNLILSVGWYTAVHRPKSTRIYHCTSGTLNPCKWGEMGTQIMANLEKVPLERAFRIPKTAFITSTVYMEYWNAVSHFGPAAIYDIFLRLTGRKPRLLNITNRILKTVSVLEYFATRSWEWSMNNTEMLLAELGPKDQQMFNFDVRQLDWVEYFENYVLGVKQYLLKEDMSGIPKAKEHLKKLRNMQYLFNTALVLLTWRLLITRSQIARNAWFFLVNFCYKLLTYLWESCPLRSKQL